MLIDGLRPIAGTICKSVSDQATNPITLKTTPGEKRWKTKASSNAVINRLPLSTNVSDQTTPAVKQTHRVSPPITAQNETPSQPGMLRLANCRETSHRKGLKRSPAELCRE